MSNNPTGKGGFKKGQSGNPNGRPPKAREERYYEIAMNTVTFARWKKIIIKAVEQAERGDSTARKWLSDYLAPQTQLHKVDASIGYEVFEVSVKDDAESSD